MVDVAEPHRPAAGLASVANGASLAPQMLGLEASVRSGSEARAFHAAIAACRLAGPAQQAAWVEAWARHLHADILVIEVSMDGVPALSLPLEVVRRAGLKVAQFVGGRHANGNFPAVLPGYRAPADPGQLARVITDAVRRARPDISLLLLERLQPEAGGIANPLVLPASRPSPNVALAVDLAGGFEATLERHSGKRKRKKHRNHARKFEEQGVIETGLARDGQEIRTLLDAFFAMKAVRFAELGIRDVFASAPVKAFFHELFAGGDGTARPGFLVHYLKVGGEVRAVTGSTTCGDRMICEFSGFVPDETENTSPGDYLFFENIGWACENGFAVHDFSVGDEPYKRLWCDLETVQRDTVIAIGPAGAVAAWLSVAAAAAKRRIKASPALWSLIRKARRLKG